MVFTLDDLFKARRNYLDGLYMRAFGPLNILKVKYGLLDNEDDLINECPNCGSPISKGNIEYCEYCVTALTFRIG